MIGSKQTHNDLWFEEEIASAKGALFVFGEDGRFEAEEILGYVQKLKNADVKQLVMKVDGRDTMLNFWGEALYCPFKTTISDYLAIDSGKFYRTKKDLKLDLEFDVISYSFLSQLHVGLKKAVSEL